jgi:hypothetical protein
MANTRPMVLFLIAVVLLWLGIWLGTRIRVWRSPVIEEEIKIITVLEGALLTLFGLLMGFTFAMAVSRYDLRKGLVVKEANAIGTTWLRTATLAEPTRTQEQTLLRQYVPVRQEYITSGDDWKAEADSLKRAGDLQARLWAVASSYATDHRDPVTGLYLSTLNESIDTAEERTAADENRIPDEAWWMLLIVGFVATVLVGMDVKSNSWVLRAMLPLVLAATLAMTMDLDSPRYGLIRIDQRSIDRLAQLVEGSPPQQAP